MKDRRIPQCYAYTVEIFDGFQYLLETGGEGKIIMMRNNNDKKNHGPKHFNFH